MISPSPLRIPTFDERAFLLATLGLGPPLESVPCEVDWDFLVAYARAHLMLPALAQAILASTAGGALPYRLREVMADASIHNEVQNRVLLVDLAEAVRILDRAGIASIVIKGAALMARFPKVVRSRHTDDIDLWVDPARARDADRVLRDKGYRDLEPALAELPDHDGRVRQGTPEVSHHLPGLISDRGTPLEIHRYPPASREIGASRWAAALGRAESVEVGGVRIAVRDAPSTLRDLCGHVVLTHSAQPILWPRHLLDVAALLDGHEDLAAKAASEAHVSERVALAITWMVRNQIRKPGGGVLARRCVFPSASHVGWGWDRALFHAAGYWRQSPSHLARALWPSAAFLKARGFDPGRGLIRANLARARSFLTRPEGR